MIRVFLLVISFISLAVAIFAPTAMAASSPKLSYVEEVGDRYQWSYWDAVSGKSVVLYTTSNLPQKFFWEKSKGLVLFVEGQDILQAAISDGRAEVRKIGSVASDFGTIEALWVDAATGGIRVATMQPVAEQDVITDGNSVHYRLKNAKIIEGMATPDWGLPYVCTVLEQKPHTVEWTVIAERGTKYMAGDTPGLSVVNDLRKENGMSQDRLLDSYTCRNGECRNEVTKPLAAAASKEVGRSLSADDLSIWPLQNAGAMLLFMTGMGDTVHMMPPVFLVRDGSETMQTLLRAKSRTTEDRQIGLGVAEEWLLVEDEFTGEMPMVIDIKTGASRFQSSRAQGAVWVPNFP